MAYSLDYREDKKIGPEDCAINISISKRQLLGEGNQHVRGKW